MKLHQLPQITTAKKKRFGRGYGSGKGGHTSSRGQKGQKSRSKVSIWFEGGQLPLSKKIPFLRGKDRFKSQSRSTLVLNLADLASLKLKDTVSPQTLARTGKISVKEAATCSIKILGFGQIDKPYIFENVQLSAAATAKIQKAGGSIKPPSNQQSAQS